MLLFINVAAAILYDKRLNVGKLKIQKRLSQAVELFGHAIFKICEPLCGSI